MPWVFRADKGVCAFSQRKVGGIRASAVHADSDITISQPVSHNRSTRRLRGDRALTALVTLSRFMPYSKSFRAKTEVRSIFVARFLPVEVRSFSTRSPRIACRVDRADQRVGHRHHSALFVAGLVIVSK